MQLKLARKSRIKRVVITQVMEQRKRQSSSKHRERSEEARQISALGIIPTLPLYKIHNFYNYMQSKHSAHIRMSPPLSPSDLLFPTAHTTLNSTLTSLKRKDLSISHRLHSILSDAAFVEKVASTYQFPLVANERCGSWYVSPAHKAGSAYFKSTDGHHGQWGFSLRRLNLQVLEVVGESGG